MKNSVCEGYFVIIFFWQFGGIHKALVILVFAGTDMHAGIGKAPLEDGDRVEK